MDFVECIHGVNVETPCPACTAIIKWRNDVVKTRGQRVNIYVAAVDAPIYAEVKRLAGHQSLSAVIALALAEWVKAENRRRYAATPGE